jgi:uncharacterized protein (TIGR00369 family)
LTELQQGLRSARHFHDVMGYRQGAWEEGRAELLLDVQPYHLNFGGVIHGGVLTTLLDVVCAQAGLYCPYPDRVRMGITLSLTTTFTGQASGGTVRAIGTLRASGRKIFSSSGEVVDENGRLLAMGEATFRFRGGSESPEGVPRDQQRGGQGDA